MAKVRAAKVPTGEPSPFNLNNNIVEATESERQEMALDEEDSDEDETSDDESERQIQPVPRSVREDIVKFEEAFKDLGRQYRLIDRIGEGEDPLNNCVTRTSLTSVQVRSRRCTKQKTFCTTSTRTTGTQSLQQPSRGFLHR